MAEDEDDGTVEGPSSTGLDADAMNPLLIEIWARTVADSKRRMRGPRKHRAGELTVLESISVACRNNEHLACEDCRCECHDYLEEDEDGRYTPHF